MNLVTAKEFEHNIDMLMVLLKEMKESGWLCLQDNELKQASHDLKNMYDVIGEFWKHHNSSTKAY